VTRPVALGLLLAVVAGCGGGPILANPPLTFPSPAATAGPTARPADPIPLAFPRDDGPHDRLTEWWYYTGHLQTASGRKFGFEAVIFRAERSTVPTAWASHLALTDEQNGEFYYAQRSEIGPQADRSPKDDEGAPSGFDLQVAGLSPTLVAAGAPPLAAPWRLAGAGGIHDIEAGLVPEEAAGAGAAFSLDLHLRDGDDVVPHDDDGFVEFGPAGSSYYYSRTRMEAAGTVTIDGEELDVQGIAWFDHQWGDFVSVGGGWDWFAINIDAVCGLGLPDLDACLPTRDVTLSVVRDGAGAPVLVYGTLVDAGSRPVRLDANDFEIEALDTWTSPTSGRAWPSGWRITIGDDVIELEPTVLDQELDTRATTGVVYWEGSQRATATRDGIPINAEAYVELTRYSN
jgi:predicted secreted hydrolase